MYNWNDGTGVLMHHGIKGQKWGVRRYQNNDGSLTAAGRERYGYGARGNYINRVGIAKANYKNELVKSAKRNSSSNGDMTKEQIKKFDKEATALARQKNSEIKNARKDFINESWNSLSDKQKTAIKVGAAVAATALVAYGAYKINDKIFTSKLNEANSLI